MKNIMMKFAFLAAVAVLRFAPMAHAKPVPCSSPSVTYTSDTNIADFTAKISSYATFSNFSGGDVSPSSPFTPTSSELAANGFRVYGGTLTGTGLSVTNNWIEATFSSPVSTIMVPPHLDHPGDAYDGYQYSIAGSNDGTTWTMLFDAQAVNGEGERFTLGCSTGTAPSTVNYVLTPGAGPGGTVGYEAQFTFNTAYRYYAFGASAQAMSQNPDQELSAVGAVSVVITAVLTSNPTVVTFNNSPGNIVQHVLDWSQITDLMYQNGITSPQLQSTNNMISNSGVYPQYVVGTPFAPSHCFDRPGNSQAGGSNDNCSLYEDQCFDSMHAPSEFNCPTTTTGFILISDIFDPQAAKPPIAPDTTAVMIHFHPPDSNQGETWSPTGTTPPAPGTVNPVCTTATGTTGSAPTPPTQCDIVNLTDFALTGDQTTITGKVKRNSMFISAYNVPMLESLVKANGKPLNTPGVQGAGITWFNTGSLNLDFLVNPGGCLFSPLSSPCPPAPTAANNNFVPAPVAGETYGVTGATTIADTAALSAPDTNTVHQADFNNNPVSLSEGINVLHWKAIDNVGILEQNIQLNAVPTTSICSDNSPATSGFCYTTTLFSAKIGVDTVAPTVTITSPTNTTYALNQTVAAAYTCTDQASGVASIVSSPIVAVGGNIDTSSVGSKTFKVTCTDVAGNSASQTVTYLVGYPNAAHLLFKVGSDQVRTGNNLTYGIFLLNFGPGTAYRVDLKDAIPAGTTFVSAVVHEVAFACAWTGCAIPSQGTNCPLAGGMVTCSIATLPSLSAVGVKLVVKVTAPAGSRLSNTAAVTGLNPSPRTGNSTSNTVSTRVAR